MVKLFIFKLFYTWAFQPMYVLGAASIVAMTGNKEMSGEAVAMFSLGVLLMVYPLGWIMDRLGRKVGMYIGTIIQFSCLLGIAWSVHISDPKIYKIMFLIFGFQAGVSKLAVITAADMFPPNRRSEAVSILGFATAIGMILGPFYSGYVGDLGNTLGADNPMVVGWLFCAIMPVISFICVSLMRPDPRTIATNLKDYYPDIETLETPSAKTIQDAEPRFSLALLASSPGAMVLVIWREFKRLFPRPALLVSYPAILVILMAFFLIGIRVAIQTNLANAFKDMGNPLTLGGWLTGAQGIGMLFMTYVWGRVADGWVPARKDIAAIIEKAGESPWYMAIPLYLLVVIVAIIVTVTTALQKCLSFIPGIDRFFGAGRKRVLLIAAPLVGLGGFLIPLMTTQIPILILQIMISIGLSGVLICMAGITTDITHPAERSKLYALAAISDSSAGYLTAKYGGIIYGRFGWKYVSALTGPLGIALFLVVLFLRERKPGVYDHKGARPEDVPGYVQ